MTRRQTVIIDNKVQKASRLGLIKTLRTGFYWKCLLSTLLVHLCISYAIWCHLNHLAYGSRVMFSSVHGPCSQGYSFIPIAFGVLLYLIYLMECWHSRSKSAKICKTSLEDAEEYIQKMRSATPIVWWKSICYHYLRRTKHVTRYRNGEPATATQVYYERINSHTSGNIFMFDSCGVKDISKDIVNLNKYPVIRMKFTKGFVFACVQAANEFEEQRMRFFNENEVRDDYMEVREGLDFAECPFVENMIVYTNVQLKPPWYFTNIAYWIASILLLSWPLRMICEWRTAHVDYQITKLFGTGYLSPSSANYTGPLTRTSTMESRELEMAVRHNYLIVPSYSEAVLLEPIGNGNIGQAFIPNLPTDFRPRNNPLITCNENTIITNYGAVEPDMPGYELPRSNRNNRFGIFGLGRHQRNLRGPIRSRSMSFCRSVAPVSTSAVPVPRTAQLAGTNSNSSSNAKVPPRSISISGICGVSANGSLGNSSGYQSHVETPLDERRPLIEPLRPILDEPPPPYEVALRMFTPLYNRLRQSTNSISSLLNALSRSNSKDLRHYSLDGPSSSKDEPNA